MKLIINIFIALIVLSGSCFGQDTTQVDLTQIGQQAPDFTFVILEGDTVQIGQWLGNTVLINFFATWCGPCKKEMPHLEKDIWQRFKTKKFRLIAIGREHTLEEVQKFKKEKKVTFPMAADPHREIYKKFATMYIPRNILIDNRGKIVYQERGFDQETWEALIQQIETLMD